MSALAPKNSNLFLMDSKICTVLPEVRDDLSLHRSIFELIAMTASSMSFSTTSIPMIPTSTRNSANKIS